MAAMMSSLERARGAVFRTPLAASLATAVPTGTARKTPMISTETVHAETVSDASMAAARTHEI